MDNQDTPQQQYNTRIKQNQEQNELRPGAMHGLASPVPIPNDGTCREVLIVKSRTFNINMHQFMYLHY
jgi:hypothetical protein